MGAQTAKLMSVFCRSFFEVIFLNSSTLNLDLKNSVCMPCNDKLMKECHTSVMHVFWRLYVRIGVLNILFQN